MSVVSDLPRSTFALRLKNHSGELEAATVDAYGASSDLSPIDEYREFALRHV